MNLDFWLTSETTLKGCDCNNLMGFAVAEVIIRNFAAMFFME